MKPGFVAILKKCLKSTTITEEGRPIKKAIIIVLLLWGGILVIGWITAPLFKTSVISGPSGSAFVTDTNGTAGLARLLDDLGIETNLMMEPVDGISEDGALVIIEPGFLSGYSLCEIGAISDFVANGGRLIYAGFPHPDLEEFLGYLDIGYNAPPHAEIIFPAGNVTTPIRNSGVRSLNGAGLPLAGENPVATARPYGKGLVIAIIDPEILYNSRISDNAAWAVAIMGEGPVFFDEYRHGFVETSPVESETGLIASIPQATRHTLYLLSVVLFIWMITSARRFGPPEKQSREMTPARSELVEAVGGLLLRNKNPIGVACPISARIEKLISIRAGLGHNVGNDEIVQAASNLGFDPIDVARALKPKTDADLLIAGQILARLNER